jgi:hypothetical protein
VQRTRDGHTGRILGRRAIERSGVTVCSLYRAQGDEERAYLDWASKPRSTVCQWFVLKTTVTISPGLASKSVATVSPDLASKPVVGGFSRFGLKIGDDGFSRFDLKTGGGWFLSV